MKTKLIRLVAAISIAAASVATLAQPVTIEFNSLNGKQGFPAILQGRGEYTDKISGVFTRPANVTGNVPVMVIMHASGGVGPYTTVPWSNFFLNMGIATFVPDSFSARGITSTANDQSQLNYGASTVDALMALKVVSELPGVDPEKIGVIGFSRGGLAAIDATFLKVRKAVLGSNPVKYALGIALYGGVVTPGTTKTPLMYLAGGNDDYQSPEAVTDYVEELRRRGDDVTLKIYPDATHGFDQERDTPYLPKVQVAKKCHPMAIDLDNMTYSVHGAPVSSKEYGDFFKSCMSHGLTMKSNRAAREDARLMVADFVRKHLKL